jgi:hypothetical protein
MMIFERSAIKAVATVLGAGWVEPKFERRPPSVLL